MDAGSSRLGFCAGSWPPAPVSGAGGVSAAGSGAGSVVGPGSALGVGDGAGVGVGVARGGASAAAGSELSLPAAMTAQVTPPPSKRSTRAPATEKVTMRRRRARRARDRRGGVGWSLGYGCGAWCVYGVCCPYGTGWCCGSGAVGCGACRGGGVCGGTPACGGAGGAECPEGAGGCVDCARSRCTRSVRSSGGGLWVIVSLSLTGSHESYPCRQHTDSTQLGSLDSSRGCNQSGNAEGT